MKLFSFNILKKQPLDMLGKRHDEQPKVKLGRTIESTVFEVVQGIILLVSWVLIWLMLRHAGDTIPTHINFSGQPDAWGSTCEAYVFAAVFSVASIALMWCAYWPHIINMPVAIRTSRQVLLKSRAARVCALIFSFLPLAFIDGMIHTRFLPLMLIVGLSMVVIIVFSVLIHRSA